jgi:glycosyltransferase involved in cell wall biosynthesis
VPIGQSNDDEAQLLYNLIGISANSISQHDLREASMPRISVLLRVYNGERYLPQAIDSILQQSFGDLELYVLDDGSEDRSLAIARAKAARDSRVIVVNGEHRGLVDGLNIGLGMAKGEFIAIMDADDISFRDRFKYQVGFLDTHPECCAVGTQAMRIDEDGLPVNCFKVPKHHDQIDGDHMCGLGAGIIHPSVMMRTSAVAQIGGYRPEFVWAEDYDLFLRLAEIGKLANLPQVLLQYRVHVSEVTSQHREAQFLAAKRALEDATIRRKTGMPLPPLELKIETEDDLIWSLVWKSFKARNFRTARKHAFRYLQRRPSELWRWVVVGATCLGPVAFQIRRFYSHGTWPEGAD